MSLAKARQMEAPMDEQTLQPFLTLIIVVAVMLVAIRFLVRAVAGPGGVASYDRLLGRARHQIFRFVRWVWLRYWRYILIFALGFFLGVNYRSP
jgi:hypothetical protein